ncbi:hypothetical protein [Sphingomonas faeni]|uniref:hypothetical protein n=1 Tax=Sphingomonas faeni TaxID=185950 RepID=UPI0024131F05|nr:hypothetical protein [Sphingomonas faeni]
MTPPAATHVLRAFALAIGVIGTVDPAAGQSSPAPVSPAPATSSAAPTLPGETAPSLANAHTIMTRVAYQRVIAAAEQTARAANRAARAAEAALAYLQTLASYRIAIPAGSTAGAVVKTLAVGAMPAAEAPADTVADQAADDHDSPKNGQTGLSPTENMPVEHRVDNTRLAVDAIAAGPANGPNDRFLKSSRAPDLQFIASGDDKVASLAWTFDVSSQPTDDHLSVDHLTMTVSSDLDSSHEAKILGLDGFSGGTEIGLSYIHYSTKAVLNGVGKPEVLAAQSNCLDANSGDLPADALCNPYAFPTGVSMFVSRYNPAGLRSLIRTVLPREVYFYGLQAAASQTDYTYLDRTSFGVRNQSKLGFKTTIFGGVIFGPGPQTEPRDPNDTAPEKMGQSALTGSFTYGRRYAENDPVTLCQPITTPQTQCLTNADGAPVRKDKAIVAVEARHGFGAAVGQFATLAIAPQVSVDLKSKAFSLDVPVYFVGDGTGKLRGGVRGVYLNRRDGTGGRDDDFTLGLFVGVPFSVFGS